MSCVETQPCYILRLDTTVGFNPKMAQRTKICQSGHLNEFQVSRNSDHLSKPILETRNQKLRPSDHLGSDICQTNYSETNVPNGSFTFDSFQDKQWNLSRWALDVSIDRAQPMNHFNPPNQTEAHSELNYSNSAQDSSSDSVNTIRFNQNEHLELHSSSQNDVQNFNDFQLSGDYPTCHLNFDDNSLHMPDYNMLCSPTDGSFSALNIGNDICSESKIYNSAPIWRNSNFMGSPQASTIYDDWSLQMTNSPISFPPSPDIKSPNVVENFSDLVGRSSLPLNVKTKRKSTDSRLSKTEKDAANISNRSPTMRSEVTEEKLRYLGRSSIEIDNIAREHPLYHNVSPQADGLYHCPWEKDPGSSCQHRPEKLKCNYDKFVDSHLKPYRCKMTGCQDLQFSSTACLLRHEREAHAMHGHGDKPFLCIYEGCERSTPGNGFPRHWNLRDHMRRIHNDTGYPKSNISGNSPSPAPTKGRKRKNSDSAQSLTKRIASSPVVKKLREPSLIDRYKQRHEILLETVKQLHDPKHVDNMTLLRNANDCIKFMAQTTQRISSAPNTVRQAG